MTAPAKPGRPTPLFEIPAGTPARKCSCGKLIWMVPHPTTQRHQPLVVEGIADARVPTADSPGLGSNHFIDCPNAKLYSRKRKVR